MPKPPEYETVIEFQNDAGRSFRLVRVFVEEKVGDDPIPWLTLESLGSSDMWGPATAADRVALYQYAAKISNRYETERASNREFRSTLSEVRTMLVYLSQALSKVPDLVEAIETVLAKEDETEAS